ncbi:MAG: hypothetical protein U5L45_24940 [Saprospiraceae bacterium]|nr:hypothetical protein [Saprospiraceae bacterium]
MAFTKKYKSLGEVILAYRLHYRQERFNTTIKKNAPRKWLEEFRFDLAKIPFDASEATIREVVIFPILRLAWKPYSDYFTLWGHKAIVADEELNGIPDYIIAKNSEYGRIVFESPYIAVIEAKMDDFTGGWAQCALEMLAIQKINNTPNVPVFGIVTNGEVWQFAQLDGFSFIDFEQSFSFNNINSIISGLSSMFEFYKAKLPQVVNQ